MQINHIPGAGQETAHAHRAATANARAIDTTATEAAAGAPDERGETGGTVSQAAKSKGQHPGQLSSSTLASAITAQSGVAATGDVPAAPGRSGETPAARASALIAENPSLADRPFGQIVSLLARGLEVEVDGSGDGSPATTETGETSVVVAPDEGTTDDDEATTPPAETIETGEGIPVAEEGPATEPAATVEPDAGLTADEMALGLLEGASETLAASLVDELIDIDESV